MRFPYVDEHDLANIPSPGAGRGVGQQELHEFRWWRRCVQPLHVIHPGLWPRVLRHQPAPVATHRPPMGFFPVTRTRSSTSASTNTRLSNSFSSSSLAAWTFTGSSGLPVRSSLKSGSSLSSAQQTLSYTFFRSCSLSVVSSQCSSKPSVQANSISTSLSSSV